MGNKGNLSDCNCGIVYTAKLLMCWDFTNSLFWCLQWRMRKREHINWAAVLWGKCLVNCKIQRIDFPVFLYIFLIEFPPSPGTLKWHKLPNSDINCGIEQLVFLLCVMSFLMLWYWNVVSYAIESKRELLETKLLATCNATHHWGWEIK